MTDEEIVALGQYCEGLLSQEHFAVLCETYKTQTIEHLLTTKPEAKERREQLFASMSGVREFLDLMKYFVSTKEKILADAEAQVKALSEEADALPLEY